MKKISILILLACTSVNLLSAQKVKLFFNPTQGETYQFTHKIAQIISNGEAGKEMTTKQNISSIMDMKVLEKKNKITKIGYTYKDVAYELINEQLSFNYKYNEPVENNPMAEMISKIYTGIIGQQFEVTHAPDGSVTKVAGLDNVIESIKKQFENDDSPMGKMIEMLVPSVFNEQMLCDMFNQSMNTYPDKKIKVGESWNVNQQMSFMNMTIDMHTLFTLNSTTKQTADVSFASSLQIDSMEGEQSGTTVYNLQTGMPQKTQLTQNLKSTAGQMPISISSEITMSVN